jgi:hypothetical protein
MRILFFSFCRCCGLFEEDIKEMPDTIVNEEARYATGANDRESPFHVKEIRQRSVDYVVQSPRFGGSGLPDCTGGTDNIPKRPAETYSECKSSV